MAVEVDPVRLQPGAPAQLKRPLAGSGAAAAGPATSNRAAMLVDMQVIKTVIRNGRIVVDEPTSLPDGHEVELHVQSGDGMTEEEQRRLHASIARGIRDGRAGHEMDLDSFVDQLDAEPCASS